MKITTRVALAIAGAVVAGTLGVGLVAHEAQTEVARGQLTEAVVRAMQPRRERCESNPAGFTERVRRRPESRRATPDDARAARRRRGAELLHSASFVVYDELGRSATGEPSLSASTLERLREGALVEHRAGLPPSVLVPMPWDEGSCAIVRVLPRRDVEAGGVGARTIAFTGLVLIVAVLAAGLALRSPLSQLAALEQAARELARSGFREHAKLDALRPRGSDEVAALAASLRDAVARIADDAARLEARDSALTEYVIHTTHDLMTPVTVLTGHLAELDARLADGPADATTAPVRSRALGEAHYLAQLVANLGLVARLDRPDAIVQKRTIDLGEIVERVAQRHRPLARSRDLELEHAVPDGPVPFEGDDLLLERALGNLVHNAIRHHRRRPDGDDARGGHVAIVLERRAHGFTLRVLDDGDALEDAALARLRTPDTSDAARTRTHGFGMEVVRRVAELHGLTLRFERAAEGGLETTITGSLAR